MDIRAIGDWGQSGALGTLGTLRTLKFLCALAMGVLIVTPLWLLLVISGTTGG